MTKSILEFLLSWGVPFLALWYAAHERFYPPGDWIGAALVSFFMALGIGALRKARFERRDARLAARPEGPPRDGERVAIAGTIEPTGEVLRAPLSGQPCVAYDYSISHIPDPNPFIGKKPEDQPSRPSPVIDRSGMALAPSVIRSGVREVRLLAFPGFEGFPESNLDEGKVGRARSYVAATKFTEHSVLDSLDQVRKVIEDRSGHLRMDWKMTSYADLENSRFEERIVPVGAKACAVGLYSAKENGIVPQAGTGGVTLIKGTRAEALSYLRTQGAGSLIFAALFIAIPGPIVYAVLTHRENYEYAHQHPSVQGTRLEALHAAISEHDAGAVDRAIRNGVDVNGFRENGDPMLLNASDLAIATALIEAGANVDAANRDGVTPIMMAAARGWTGNVQLLIARRANVNAKSRTEGMSALDYAVYNGNDDIAALLRAAGAQK